jgi:ribosomal protein S18 acetylase RimI-like enzyme
MQLEVINAPDKALCEFFNQRIEEFNLERWEVTERRPLVIRVTDLHGEIVGGVAARTFGEWLLIDNLWVSAKLRGQNWGSKILRQLEATALERGCKYSLLDTLNFQARPFYEKYGYKVEWQQKNYPRDGCKYFMTKQLMSGP